MWLERNRDILKWEASVAGLIRSVFLALICVVMAELPGVAQSDDPAQYNEKAMALYADAANFQTNGAIDLAIEGWEKYLSKYPNEPFAAKAAHYLGVCYMQQATPDFPAACDAFELAVKDTKSELREESLVNLGWCQFAAAGEGEQQDAKRLQSALDTFRLFLKEKPSSKFADRALFYGGEAAYSLGDAKSAIVFYDRLISMESAKDSPLRCDTYYARGVALADLQKYDDAIVSFRQLMDACKDDRLIIDARVRIGDVLILQKKFDDAAKEFATVASGKSDDVPYALVRQAFAMVQAGKPDEAATLYERLLKDFPDSPFTASATLASAQSIYRAGDLEEATKRFNRVLGQKNISSATEAAHWLATIAMRKGSPQEAMEIAQKQIDSGATGDYAPMLKLDLAEAMMLLPGKVEEAQKLYLSLYRATPQGPLASRALYNAAFAALQLGQTQEATTLAAEFLERFKDSPLSPDVRYIVAESKLMGGDHAAAAKDYQQLLDDPATEANMQRPLWSLRAGMATYLAGQHDDAIKLLEKQVAATVAPPQLAEAKYIIGASHLAAGRPVEAATSLRESLKADAKWFKADETMLLLGQSLSASGKTEEANQAWDELAKAFPNSPRSDMALYNIAQATSKSGAHEEAATQYVRVITSGRNASLLPFSLYGQGWNLLQAGKPEQSIEPLSRVAKEFPTHSIADDAMLALGISLRTLGKTKESTEQLQMVLKVAPEGINRGHALYELALIDQQQKKPKEAAERLEQLVASVPDYPSIDKVLYELGWSLKESGQEQKAESTFAELIEKFPTNPLVAEAHYFIGQRRYGEEKWSEAATLFEKAASIATDKELLQKAYYRLGWSQFKAGDFKASGEAFAKQAADFPAGNLIADAMLMVAENQYQQKDYKSALELYKNARARIESKNESAKNVSEGPERQIRELVFLHGGQSAAQLQQWKVAIEWYEQLRERFPETGYLAQTLYELGFAHQQLGNDDEALTFFSKVAADYRTETAARSRFMIGEIYFAKRDLAKAIPEFQRVMYGYGAENAPEAIKNWQAKSGFEAGRCAELLIQNAKEPAQKEKAATIARDFFKFVVEKHPKHELASKSQERLDILNRINPKTGALNAAELKIR